MSDLTTDCPTCRKPFVLQFAWLGKRGRCDGCGTIFKLPRFSPPKAIKRAVRTRLLWSAATLLLIVAGGVLPVIALLRPADKAVVPRAEIDAASGPVEPGRTALAVR